MTRTPLTAKGIANVNADAANVSEAARLLRFVGATMADRWPTNTLDDLDSIIQSLDRVASALISALPE